MEKYWVANFDLEECLQYGLRNKLWMMQYQYSDPEGNVFQGEPDRYGQQKLGIDWQGFGRDVWGRLGSKVAI